MAGRRRPRTWGRARLLSAVQSLGLASIVAWTVPLLLLLGDLRDIVFHGVLGAVFVGVFEGLERSRDRTAMTRIRGEAPLSSAVRTSGTPAQVARLGVEILVLHAVFLAVALTEADDLVAGDVDLPVGLFVAGFVTRTLRWRRLARWEAREGAVLFTPVRWLGDMREFGWRPPDWGASRGPS